MMCVPLRDAGELLAKVKFVEIEDTSTVHEETGAWIALSRGNGHIHQVLGS
jgi:hypothetical protein